MDKSKRWLWLLSIVILLAPASMQAQTGNPYQLMGSLAAGGEVGGGGYEIAGTIGQASIGEMQGGEYRVVAGFWVDGEVDITPRPDWTDASETIFLPVVER